MPDAGSAPNAAITALSNRRLRWLVCTDSTWCPGRANCGRDPGVSEQLLSGRHPEPLDDAILKHEHPAIAEYEKVDEIPFDFNRKRPSVVACRRCEQFLITKGEAESVFAVCETLIVDRAPQPFDGSRRALAAETFQKLGADGYRTLGVAVRKVRSFAAASTGYITTVIARPTPGYLRCKGSNRRHNRCRGRRCRTSFPTSVPARDPRAGTKSRRTRSADTPCTSRGGCASGTRVDSRNKG
jgi:hypothetical protein